MDDQKDYTIQEEMKGVLVIKWHDKDIYIIDEKEVSGSDRAYIATKLKEVEALLQSKELAVIIVSSSLE